MIHIYHHNDLDGKAAASVMLNYYSCDNNNVLCDSENNEYFKASNDEDISCYKLTYRSTDFDNLDDIKKGDIVYVLDYSLNREQLLRLQHVNERALVVWCDHHVTSLQYKDMLPGKIDTSYCGAILIYKYAYGNGAKIPKHLKFVNDHDLWRHKLEHTREFKEGVDLGVFDGYIHPNLINLMDLWFKDEPNSQEYEELLNKIINDGACVLKYIIKDIDFSKPNLYECEFEGYKCIVINKFTNADMFEDVKNEYDICVTWIYTSEGKFKYTLYSDTINVSKICQKYGGGGHFGAAGFSSDELLFKL